MLFRFAAMMTAAILLTVASVKNPDEPLWPYLIPVLVPALVVIIAALLVLRFVGDEGKRIDVATDRSLEFNQSGSDQGGR